MSTKARALSFLLLALLAACNAPVNESTEPAPPPVLPRTPQTDGLPAILCEDEQPPLITGFDVFQPPHLPEPAARLPFRDPVFGTCLVRVTDRALDLASGDSSTGLKNEDARPILQRGRHAHPRSRPRLRLVLVRRGLPPAVGATSLQRPRGPALVGG